MPKLFLREDSKQLDEGVRKTKEGAFGRVASLFRQQVITEETWEELEELLLQADLGPAAASKLVEQARQEVEQQEIRTPVEAETAVRRQMVAILGTQEHLPLETMPAGTVVLIVGVNGSGKTTSVAKLGRFLQQHGRSVLFAAADTFRAAAIEQLGIWGARVGVAVIRHQQNADPGAVVFDAITAAKARGIDLVVVDTAGRLHTKFNLMKELEKIKRVVGKANPQSQAVSLLVLDATTGQNAILQARAFLQSVAVDGVVLAKLDGTTKGGVAFSVYVDLGLPIWFVGTGETLDDFASFNHLEFVNALFS